MDIQQNQRAKRTSNISASMLALTLKKLTMEGFHNFELRETDCRNLPHADDTFDVLYNGYMLDLIPLDDSSLVVTGFKRVLKPGGRLILFIMSKFDEKITTMEKLYTRLPAKFVLYLFGMCCPVLMKGLVKESGLQQVSRTVLKSTPASEVVTGVKKDT